MQLGIIKRIFFIKISHFYQIWIYIYRLYTYMYNVRTIYFNWTQRRCFNSQLKIFKYHFDTNIKPTSCNWRFYSYTGQFVWQYLIFLWNNKLMMLGFAVFFKNLTVCQHLKVLSIEERKETRKFSFLWRKRWNCYPFRNWRCFHLHDDVIKWKHFLRYLPFVRGIHRSPLISPDKGQWRGAFMFSFISAWISGWVNNRESGDLRCHRTHYDAIVMSSSFRNLRARKQFTLILFTLTWTKHAFSKIFENNWQVYHSNLYKFSWLQ